MKPYKIALVLDDSLDTPDGVQQYVLNVGRWLSENGHTVHYLVGETKHRPELSHVHSIGRNVKVRFNQNRMSMPLPTSNKKIRELLAAEQYDVIHVQMPYSPFLAGRIVKNAGARTAVVATFHVAPHGKMVHAANVLLRLMVHGSIRRFDEFISVSPVAQKFAQQTFRIQSTVVPNTVDLTNYYAPKQFKKYATSTNIEFFGRLVERKGAQYFLRAINRLHKADQLPRNCRVLVCGAGPLDAQLKAYVAQNGLADIVDFAGFIPEEDKGRWLACGDIVAYPSTGGESFGIVLLEGMAASRGMVLAGDNPGYRGVLGDHPEVLFDPKDEAAFAEKLHEYLASDKLRKQAAAWQKPYARTFDLPNVMHKILEVYEQALHKRRS